MAGLTGLPLPGVSIDACTMSTVQHMTAARKHGIE